MIKQSCRASVLAVGLTGPVGTVSAATRVRMVAASVTEPGFCLARDLVQGIENARDIEHDFDPGC